MSLFRDKNTNSNTETIEVYPTTTPIQNTAPTDDSKLWIDTSEE